MNKRSKKEDRLYNCELCNKEKEALYPSIKQRFCSHKCSNQWKWDNVRKEERKTEHKCYNCNKLCKKPKTTKIIEGVFCSRKCFGNYRYDNPPDWLIPFKKGHESWNKGKTMDMEFRVLCKKRAEKQWTELSFREKQMKRTDRVKFQKAGIRALKLFWSKPENAHRRMKAGKVLHNRFLEKVGVIANG